MYGFTIVLRRKKGSIRGAKRNTNRVYASDKRRNRIPSVPHRSRVSREKKRLPIKFSRLLPMIFLIATVCFSALLEPKNEGKTVEKHITAKNSIDELLNISRDEYSFYYIPIVINDIEDFDSSESKFSDEMTAACCWSLMSDEDAKEKYEYFEDKTIIPSEDVEYRFEKLFGKNIEFDNRSVQVNGCKIEYLDGKYTVSVSGITPTFLPKLLKFESEMSTVTLTVGCLKNDEYVQDADGNTVEPKPYKKLKIELSGDIDNYCIKSVKKI